MAGPKRIVLDTNYIIRLVVRDVPDQTKEVVRLIDEAATDSLIVSDVVFGEAVYVLEKVYEYEREVIVKALSYVLEHSAFDVRSSLLTAALGKYLNNKKLSFVDCYGWAHAKTGNHNLLTFDNDLKRAV